MKMNNKGFAISSMMYSILLLFLMLVVGVLAILGSRKVILDKIKNDIMVTITEKKEYRFSFQYKDILLSNTADMEKTDFDLLEGVKITDQNGGIIHPDIYFDSYPMFNPTENGIYEITYSADYNGKIITDKRVIEVVDPNIYEFTFTGETQTFTSPNNGNYKIELWGAQGGNTSSYTGGKGAYTSGTIDMPQNMRLYIHVGGKGEDSGANGGYNGGGSLESGQEAYGSSGGGATDIRLSHTGVLEFESLKSRIMVASGGGGANFRGENYGEGNGGAGGALTGLDGISTKNTNGYGYGIGTGGSQTAGGTFKWTAGTASNVAIAPGIFGQGGGIEVNNISAQSGGGSGYYGGSASAHGGAGGGSSFISGHTGCNAISETSTVNNIIHTGNPVHYSDYKFNNTVMKAGNEEMPDYYGTSTITGNSGDGFAKITALWIERSE